MFRVLVAPDFKITESDPDFPPALLETLKSARAATDSNYVSFWAELGNPDFLSRLIVSTYPAPWLRRYAEKNYASIDPLITAGLHSVEPVIFELANPETPELADFAADALMHEIGAFTIGLPVRIGGNIRAITIFSTDMDLTAETDASTTTMARFHEQADIVSIAVTERFMKTNIPHHTLTEREIEVLYWGSCGKTDQQTADLLGLSRWTVVAHVQSAKAKLGVSNKAAAIASALRLSLFTRFDHGL
ncbi:helix-turn-helix transcriptional regulator [Oricola thermophila]|uniref:Autoinducer binding domain-containing protein n=1 Tax=Oricola thermophila TaxID=2742145 RepID=A0A6N1V9M1_9HYPH|nr:autoinducer binding domain-containing protein [Oricola thermophila]QKV17223.1 autoinducer binding domain-containing protein [Oricola thermophila]